MTNKNEAKTTQTRQISEAEKAETIQPESVVLIYTTFPSLSEAQKAARKLVEDNLAACVNIFPGMFSVYSWLGGVEEGNEAAMLIKTAAVRKDDVLTVVKQLHPDELPARLVLPVIGGGNDFLQWVVAGSTQIER